MHASNDAVIDDRASLIEQQTVTRHSDPEIGIAACIGTIEEGTGVRSVDLDLAQRSYVDEPDAATHGGHFARDASLARFAFPCVVLGPTPVSCQHPHGAGLAVPLRKNLPVALIMTLYTNPFTIVPLYLVAYKYGKLLLGVRHNGPSVEPFDFDWSNFFESVRGLCEWALALGKPLGVGLVALALTLAVLGYFTVRIGWRVYVIFAWRRRCRQRQLARR